MFNNLDAEGKCLVYQYGILFSWGLSFVVLFVLRMLTELTLTFGCVFYLCLFFSGYSILHSNPQKQDQLAQNQSPDR
jgi:hypothetical protein